MRPPLAQREVGRPADGRGRGSATLHSVRRGLRDWGAEMHAIIPRVGAPTGVGLHGEGWDQGRDRGSRVRDARISSPLPAEGALTC